MPTYDFHCNKCDHVWDRILKIADKDSPLSGPCPKCAETGNVVSTIGGAPSMGDPIRLGIRRPDSGMKEVLQKIASKTAGGGGINETSQLTRL